MEPFATGDAVTLSDAQHTMGRIIGVSDDGRTVEVHWHRRPGHDHEVTQESSQAIRRVHESEEGML
jgi:hypothetical protein